MRSTGFAAAFLLSGCAMPSTESASYRGAVQYGPTTEIAGVWIVSFEHSNFVACPDRANCRHQQIGCWLEASQDFRRRVQESARPELARDNMLHNGLFYLRFQGQTARNGPFGHAGLYRCQVRPLRLLSAESL